MSKPGAKLSDLGEESAKIADANLNWCGRFEFTLSEPQPPHVLFLPTLTVFQKINVFEHLSNALFQDFRLYFDPAKYPLGNFGSEKLLDDLVKHAPSQGCNLVRRNKRTNASNDKQWKLSCSGFREYVSNYEPRDAYAFRPTLIRSDVRKGSRGPVEGISGPRRRNSTRSFKSDSPCPFQLTIFEGQTAYYLKVGGKTGKLNCDKHSGHLSVDANGGKRTTRLCEVTSIQRKTIENLVKTGMGYHDVCTVMKENDGAKLLPHHIRFFAQKLYSGENDDSTTPSSMSANDVIAGLIKEKHDFVTLFQHANGASATSEATTGTSKIQKNLGEVSDEFKDYLHSKRTRDGLSDEEPLLLGVIWVTADERSLFEKFPNVIKIDTTFGTNEQGLPLVTITGKTANNEVFVIARGNLPNERAFVFKWIFDEALPALFPSQVLNRVKLIISDGDSQEINQISSAVSPGGTLEFAIRLQCVFHIVDRSWNKKVYYLAKRMDESHNSIYEHIRRLLMHWIYSWCTSATESREEFVVSKGLLKHYMQSTFFRKRIGRHYYNVLEWFKGVESTIDLCLFYKRKTVVAFEEYTNSSAESNFKSMKYGYSKVHKKMSASRSNFHLNVQAEQRTSKIREKAVSDLVNSCVWSQLPEITSNLSTFGAGLFETAYNKRFDYRSRQDENVFLVAPIASVDDATYSDFSAPFVPIFRRVRTVTLATGEDGGRVLRCDCSTSERTMLVCRHQIHILDKYFDLAKMHYTSMVHPYWWASYGVHAFPSRKAPKETRNVKLQKILEQISVRHDQLGYDGPNLGDQEPNLTAVNDEYRHFERLPVHESIINWSVSDIELVAPELCATKMKPALTKAFGGLANYSQSIIGMSQTSITFATNLPDSSSHEGPFSPDSVSVCESLAEKQENSTVARLLPLESGSPLANIDSTKVNRLWQRRFDEVELNNRKEKSTKERGAFQVLNPMFKELISVLERNPSKLEERTKNFEWMIMETDVGESSIQKRDGSGLPMPGPKRLRSVDEKED
jgi:hypothetical protein